MKKALIVVVLLLLAAGGAAVWVLNSLDAIVKRQIETVGTELTGTKVRVGGVRIKLQEASGEIRELSIANPAGYSEPEAFHLGRLRLAIDVDSLGNEPLTLEELTIEEPRIALEIEGRGQTNLKTLTDNITKHAQSDGGASTGEDAAPIRLRIRKLVIKDAAYLVRSPAEQIDGTEGTLPTIVLSNVGGSNGATPAELGKLVVTELARRVANETARSRIGAAIEKKLDESGAKEVGESLKNMFR